MDQLYLNRLNTLSGAIVLADFQISPRWRRRNDSESLQDSGKATSSLACSHRGSGYRCRLGIFLRGGARPLSIGNQYDLKLWAPELADIYSQKDWLRLSKLGKTFSAPPIHSLVFRDGERVVFSFPQETDEAKCVGSDLHVIAQYGAVVRFGRSLSRSNRRIRARSKLATLFNYCDQPTFYYRIRCYFPGARGKTRIFGTR